VQRDRGTEREARYGWVDLAAKPALAVIDEL